MTQDEIIRMAREVWGERAVLPFNELERFASLVAAHEREKQAEQKPVCIGWDGKTDEPIMGYAAPVRTKDLTDDEIHDVFKSLGFSLADPRTEDFSVARAVIAADREKNK